LTSANLPDAEITLERLADKMRGAVAYDAKLVGIHSGGAWIAGACRDARRRASGRSHRRVAYRDDYAQKGARPLASTTLPFEVGQQDRARR
jgi:pyrimidine operon attenuation protein/uracil phosphoribosyltransferase